jgi:hypothetical protein
LRFAPGWLRASVARSGTDEDTALDDILARAWHGLLAGVTGPLKFRFVLQPLVAAIIALRAGVTDAHEGRRPFAWALASDHGHRREHLSRGWAHIRKLFFVAVGMDLIFQLIVRRRVVPFEAVLVASILALVPYLLLCGPMNRLARWRLRHGRHATE